MNEELLAWVVDTFLPGDDGDPPLPRASDVGVGRALAARIAAEDGDPYQRAIEAVTRAAGGADGFGHASGDERSAAVAEAERAMPAELRALVVLALESYYQSEAVIRAMGWRPQSPQPLGHPVEPLDLTLLDEVRRRARR